MLHRMKWEDDVIKTKDELEPKSNNKCSLVWEVIKNHYIYYESFHIVACLRFIHAILIFLLILYKLLLPKNIFS